MHLHKMYICIYVNTALWLELLFMILIMNIKEFNPYFIYLIQ